MLTLPGGMVDPGEAPQETAARELREETGHSAGSVEVVVSAIRNASPYHRHVAIGWDCTPAAGRNRSRGPVAYVEGADPRQQPVPGRGLGGRAVSTLRRRRRRRSRV